MPAKTVMSLALFLSLASCAGPYSNVRHYDLDQSGLQALVVIDQTPHGSALGYVDDQDRLHVIRADLNTMGYLREIHLSPDRTKVMIESSGEGHQFISIYIIEDLIEEHRRGAGFIDTDRSLDPFPYGFWDIEWVTNDSIRFSAHADMHQFDPDTRRGKTTLDDAVDLERRWTWHLEQDAFEVWDGPR